MNELYVSLAAVGGLLLLLGMLGGVLKDEKEFLLTSCPSC